MPITLQQFLLAFNNLVPVTPDEGKDTKKAREDVKRRTGKIEAAVGNLQAQLAQFPEKHPARKQLETRLQALLDKAPAVASAGGIPEKFAQQLTVIKNEIKGLQAASKDDKFIRRDKKAWDYLERYKDLLGQLAARGITLPEGFNEAERVEYQNALKAAEDPKTDLKIAEKKIAVLKNKIRESNQKAFEVLTKSKERNIMKQALRAAFTDLSAALEAKPDGTQSSYQKAHKAAHKIYKASLNEAAQNKEDFPAITKRVTEATKKLKKSFEKDLTIQQRIDFLSVKVRSLMSKIPEGKRDEKESVFRSIQSKAPLTQDDEKDLQSLIKDLEILKRTKTIEVEGQALTIDPRAIPGHDGFDDVKFEQIHSKIAAKIGRGKKLIDAIKNCSDIDEFIARRRPTKDKIADIVWYIRTLAEGKVGEAFEKGALTAPDPDGKIRKYLDHCSDNYLRASSHLKEEQDKDDGRARGMDFYNGNLESDADIDETLPYGMNTLLTQTVYGKEGSRMLYFKSETEGARGYTTATGENMGGKATRDRIAVRHNLHDRAGTLKHGTNHAGGGDTTKNKELARYDERGIEYKEIQAAYDTLKGKAELKDAPSSVKSLEEIRTALMVFRRAASVEVDPTLGRNLNAFITTVNKKIPGLINKDTRHINEDVYNNQFGGEVQLSEEDFGSRPRGRRGSRAHR